MSGTWFVTGTDTEVGKTAVSCALLAAAASEGLRTAAIKPVAAGCDAKGCNEDALRLLAAMTGDLEYHQVNPVALQADRLAGLCRGVMLGGADFVLVEGAGGWRVPINPRETLADVAVQLGAGVILVVGMRLGCINHALLTAEAIHRDGLPLAGWVANQPGERMNRHEENLDTLRRLLPAPLLGDVPFMRTPGGSEMAVHLDIRPLLTGVWGRSMA